ncbi:MAG TPA: carboxypeptidase-like regulatory domain-containing protein, partial [Nitrososphaera sp.]
VELLFENKELVSMPADMTIESAVDSDSDGVPEIKSRSNITLAKDLTGTFANLTLGPTEVVVTMKAVLDDGTERTTTMTHSGSNIYTGTIPGPFSGTSVRIVVEVDALPADGTPEATQEGDVILIDPSGTVFDRITGDPIDGAEVTLLEEQAPGLFTPVATGGGVISPDINPITTDADGEYTWLVPSGTYRVTASATGYDDFESGDLLVPPPQSGVNLYLLPDGATLTYEVETDAPAIEVGDSIEATASTNDQAAVAVLFEWFDGGSNLVESTEVPLVAGTASDSITADTAGGWSVTATFLLRVSDQIDDLEVIDDAEADFTVSTVDIGGGGGDDDDEDNDDDRRRRNNRDGPRPPVIIIWNGEASVPPGRPFGTILIESLAFLNAAGLEIDEAQVGQQVSIAGEFTNNHDEEQDYAFIIQVIDENDMVTDIAWQQGTLSSGDTAEVSTVWIPEIAGDYTIKIFVWDGISTTPQPLSEVTVNNISVS